VRSISKWYPTIPPKVKVAFKSALSLPQKYRKKFDLYIQIVSPYNYVNVNNCLTILIYLASPTNYPLPYVKDHRAMSSESYKELGCEKIIPFGECAYITKGESDEEVIRLLSFHAKTDHHIKNIPPSLVAKIRATIKTAEC
jgi:predicted small metal-binding protein